MPAAAPSAMRSVVVGFPLVSYRQHQHKCRVHDLEEGHVARGAERDDELAPRGTSAGLAKAVGRVRQVREHRGADGAGGADGKFRLMEVFDGLRPIQQQAFPPSLNAPDRPPTALDALNLRFATVQTWSAWSTVGRAELWQLVALSLHLDPEGLPWRDLPADKSVASIAGLFRGRMREALHAILMMSLPTFDLKAPEGQWVIKVSDFTRWLRNDAIQPPSMFPDGESRHHGPEVQAAAQLRAPPQPQVESARSEPADFLRQSDLIPKMLPFAAATLWRKVKSGDFPAPVKISVAVTAWRRDEVEAWLAMKSQPAAAAKKKVRK